ncbi:MAG: glutathione S-transferase family protein [Hyphomicrobiales bacterium]|nr:glutathione S-transferase family protein [Hyphomicrobiales bacterium]MBV8429079.1 glutathione S-transferase family protein [Hyphomicrobiales bacterium]
MMILRSSPASPFGRKIRIAAALLGLADRISVVQADTGKPDDPLRKDNPLGKLPVLVPEGGKPIYDSRVILEYLDHLAGAGKIFPNGSRRFEVLTLQALADGILDASILRVYEVRMRSEDKREASWVAYQADKVARGLRVLEANPPALSSGIPDAGQITLACALGYQDLRFEGKWREGHPNLVAWLDAFAKAVPAFEETRFRG